MVDDEDLDRVSALVWTAVYSGSGKWYAMHQRKGHRAVLMHRFIMCARPGEKIDHMDGDGLNNQRSNLRLATTSQNGMNSRGKTDHRSGRFKGVMWEASRGLFAARIKVDGVYLNLGRFMTDTAAAWAYDQAAREHYGQFARLNGVADPGDDGTRRHRTYSPELKEAVLAMADSDGRQAAVSRFQIPDWCIDEWRKQRRRRKELSCCTS